MITKNQIQNLNDSKSSHTPDRRYNATTHGVLTKILTDSEKEVVQVIYEELKIEFNPVTFSEDTQIQNAAIWYVRLQRAIKAEQEYLMELSHPTITEERVIREGVPDPGDMFSRKVEIVVIDKGYHAEFNIEQIEKFSGIYIRYITTCERNFNRALHELLRIRSIRLGVSPNVPAVDVIIDKLGSEND